MGNWFRGLARIFIGTPQRFLAFLAALAVIYTYHNPGFLQNAIHQVLGEVYRGVNPWVVPMFHLAILVFAIYFIITAPFRRGKKK
jgi:hypothetical protein